MTNSIIFNQFWGQIDKDATDVLEHNFEDMSNFLLQFILGNVSAQENFEIGVYKENEDKGAMISYHEQNKNLDLRINKNSAYELILTLLNNNEKFIYKHQLSQEETQALPLRLKRLMETIKEIGRPLTFYKGF